MRITSDFGNWNDLWEEIENVKPIEEDFEDKNKIQENIEEVQEEAAAYLLGRV